MKLIIILLIIILPTINLLLLSTNGKQIKEKLLMNFTLIEIYLLILIDYKNLILLIMINRLLVYSFTLIDLQIGGDILLLKLLKTYPISVLFLVISQGLLMKVKLFNRIL